MFLSLQLIKLLQIVLRHLHMLCQQDRSPSILSAHNGADKINGVASTHKNKSYLSVWLLKAQHKSLVTT